MARAVGEAPGKILLVGEHAVVYGHPAIAIPLRGVRARAEVELTRNGEIELASDELPRLSAGAGTAPGRRGGEEASGPGQDRASERLAPLVRLAGSVLEVFGEQKQGLRIRVHSTIPMRRGMGSGAAVAVALVRGICGALGRRLDVDQVWELALEAEREFHGNPSGVDCAVVARGEPIYFVRGKPPQEISVGANHFRFVVADTGIESPTAGVVEEVRSARERERARFDSYFWELGSMASVAREAIRSGASTELGVCMTQAHSILQRVGVSCPELDRLVEVALRNGALGAKLSGAGRGGAMIALLEDEADEEALATQLRLAGAESTITTSLGATA
jgi:mevalonate kinase